MAAKRKVIKTPSLLFVIAVLMLQKKSWTLFQFGIGVVSKCAHERYLFSSGVCQQFEKSHYLCVMYFVKFSFVLSLSN